MSSSLTYHAVAGLAAVLLCSSQVFVAQARADGNDLLRSEDIVKLLAGPEKIPLKRKGVKAAPVDSTPHSTSNRAVLSAIQFHINSHELTDTALVQVREVAKAFETERLRPFHFVIQGHTDSRGSSAYNRSLSLKRARAVRGHLVAANVSNRRLLEVGLGEDFPIVGISGDDGRNRRVEIVNLGALDSDMAIRRAKRRALLIGIGDYRSISPLYGPANDAAAMKTFVVEHLGFDERNVMTLLNADATRDAILTAIREWLIDGTELGDEALLYFSGHGFRQRDDGEDESDGFDETLVPVDARVRGDAVIEGMITDDEIAELLSQLSGRKVQVIIDASFAQTAESVTPSSDDWRYIRVPRRQDGRPARFAARSGTRKKGLAAPYPEVFVSHQEHRFENVDVTVWTAVTGEQVALVDDGLPGEPGSLFTRRIVSGVRDGQADRDRDGSVTRSELYGYLVRESATYCNRHSTRCPHGLDPGYESTTSGLGDVAFSRTEAPPHGSTSSARDTLVRLARHLLANYRANGVRLRLDPGSNMEIGSQFHVFVESDRDGFLVLLDIDAEGNLVQVFPSDMVLRSGVPVWVDAGKSVRLPGAPKSFWAGDPAGNGTLVAVVSEETPQLRDLVSRHPHFSSISSPHAYLVELSEVLQAARATRNGLAAAATLDYLIE